MQKAFTSGTAAGAAVATDESFGVRRRAEASESEKKRSSSSGSAATVTPAAAPPTFASRMLMSVFSATLVLSALAYGTVNSWALAIFQAGAALVLLLWSIDALFSGVLRINRNLLQLPLAALVGIGIVQMLPLVSGSDAGTLSLDPYQTRLATIRTFALLIYFAAILAFVDRPERLNRIVRLVIVFGFVLALIGIFQSFISPTTIYGLREIENAFPFGPFVNRHHFANYMLLALALPLGLLFAGAIERDRQMLFVFAALVMGIALVMTGSRGAMVSLVVQIAFLVGAAGVATRAKHERDGSRESTAEERRAGWLKRAGAAFGLLVLLLIGVLMFGGEAGLSRLLGTLDAKDPTTGRFHLWTVTLRMIADRPLLGAGLGAYGAAFTGYDTHGGALQVLQAHNDYLQVLADTGIVGACLGVFFLVVLYRTGWRCLRSPDRYRRGVCLGALTGCTGMLAHSFFEFPSHTTSNALLFLVLAALATLGSQVDRPHTPSKRRRRHSGSRTSGSDSPRSVPNAAEQANRDVAEDAVATFSVTSNRATG